jgi:TIR domain
MNESDRPAETEQTFLYDAFISYRHVDRDRKWAEWLIDALERYRLPKALQDKGYPARLRKIFRDEDEVPASADLNDQIKQALIGSRFLIVVCSAFTPRSKWVEREIEMFNELGRGDQVLALLTEGEPGDSFPNAMLVRHREVIAADGSRQIDKEDKEPLAADVRPRSNTSLEQLKQIALLRLVAVIVGVKFDELRERERERERRRLFSRAAAAAMAVLLVGGAAAAYWQHTRPTTSHYRQVIWRWAVPEGLGPIDETTRSRREVHYAVVTRRLGILQAPKVVEVRQQRSRGALVGRHEEGEKGSARWVIIYGDSGTPDRIEVYDATNRLLRAEVFERASSRPNKLIVRSSAARPTSRKQRRKS